MLSRAGDGAYGLTALGEQLRDDHPGGLRPWLDIDGAIGRADLCFVQLLHTVRTGEPAFPRQFGRPYWDDLAADDARSASFDALMGSRLVAEAPAVAAAYPWGELGHVVDVGGGNGSLLIALLRVHEGLRGTVIDLAGPVDRARQAIRSAGLDDRAGAQAGSFFDALPAGAGGYLLSGVLHDWDDEDALRILRRCAGRPGPPDGCSPSTTSPSTTSPMAAKARSTPRATCACCATSAAGSAPSTGWGNWPGGPPAARIGHAAASRSIIEFLPSS